MGIIIFLILLGIVICEDSKRAAKDYDYKQQAIYKGDLYYVDSKLRKHDIKTDRLVYLDVNNPNDKKIIDIKTQRVLYDNDDIDNSLGWQRFQRECEERRQAERKKIKDEQARKFGYESAEAWDKALEKFREEKKLEEIKLSETLARIERQKEEKKLAEERRRSEIKECEEYGKIYFPEFRELVGMYPMDYIYYLRTYGLEDEKSFSRVYDLPGAAKIVREYYDELDIDMERRGFKAPESWKEHRGFVAKSYREPM